MRRRVLAFGIFAAALAACSSSSDGGPPAAQGNDAGFDAGGSPEGGGSPDANQSDGAAIDGGNDASEAAAPSQIDWSKARRFYYVLDTGSAIWRFNVDAAGAFDTGSVYTSVTGVGDVDAVVTPSWAYLFTINNGANPGDRGTVTSWTVQQTVDNVDIVRENTRDGGTDYNDVQVGVGAFAGAVDPSSSHLFVSSQSDATITTLAIDGTGHLTVSGTPASTLAKPQGLAVDPSGKYLVVAANGASQVSSFAIGAAGALAGRQDATVDAGPTFVAMHPTLEVAYVLSTTPGKITALSIGGNGALTTVGAAVSTGTSPAAIAIHPTLPWLYVSNNGDAAIGRYAIAADGSLTASGTTTAPTAGRALTMDPGGRWMYLATDDGDAHAFGLDGSGAVTTLPHTATSYGGKSFRNPIVPALTK
jgi:hypothetical protein